MLKTVESIGIIIGAIIVIFGALAVEAWLCMLLWNWVIVALFSLNPINFWLGFGIMIIINLAIGLFR